ncbi:hypothetical protein BE17_44700 [Sorangium cellulosum]|uniref:Uncharacterized protein n=1 Tax=Sorangium cellulosum TaxID=56 RepID=A0A150SGH5_SORCE|nr:hypothetical protein BE17_44700 [Sorangium cellulosum]
MNSMGRSLARRATTVCALILSLALLSPAAVRAQSVDPQKALAAQALYEQASVEMDEKKYASACRKLEEVARLVPEGLGAKLTLGECYEALGKLASAWSQYALVEAMAPKVGQLERAERAAARAAALKPKLATLTIEVPEAVASTKGLAITRDGVPIGDAQWGAPLPVDAGGHEIVATAPARKPWTKQVEVVIDGAQVAVAVPPLELEAAAGAAAPAPDAGSERPWQRPAAFVAMGLGAAGLAAGAVLGGLAMAKNGDSNDANHCDAQDRCDPTGISLRRDAVGLGNGSTAAFIVGGVLAAGGVVLLVTAPSTGASSERAGSRPALRATSVALLPGGVALRGVW